MKDYKTTITGLILAILIGVQPIVETGEIDLKKDWLKLLIASGIAIFGFLTKDYNKKENDN